MPSQQPELAPDLEWMLTSNQVDNSLILETLVQEAYLPVFRLALSLLDDAQPAHRATLATFHRVVRDKHQYRSEQPVMNWLFTLAIAACRRSLAGLRWQRAGKALLAPFRREEAWSGVLPQTEPEAQLWLALDALPQKLALPLKLQAIHGLSPGESAACLGIPEKTVRSRLDSAYQRLSRSRAFERRAEEIKPWLAESLHRRWPEPGQVEERLGAVQAEIEKQATFRHKTAPALILQKALLGALAALAILLIGWTSYALFPAEEQVSLTMRTQKVVHDARVTATPRAEVAPTIPLMPPIMKGSRGPGLATGAEQVTPEALAGLPPREQIDLQPILVTLYGEDALDMWSNSGPILLSRVLDYWGVPTDLDQITRSLQPGVQDENVMPYELENYVAKQTSLKAVYRLGGDFPTLARLIQAGFLPILQKGYSGSYAEDWLGHYSIASGYDQTQGASLLLINTIEYEPRTRVRFSEFQQDWRAFNYSYLVVYPQEKEAELARILGENIQAEYNYRQAFIRASQEIFAHNRPLDQFYAWFNRGTSLTYLEDYRGAAESFDKAFAIFLDLPEQDRPERLLWYQSRPYWAYYYSGRYQDVIRLADATLERMPDPVLEESLFWRALAREGLGDEPGAIVDLKESLRLNPHFEAGTYHLQRIQGGS